MIANETTVHKRQKWHIHHKVHQKSFQSQYAKYFKGKETLWCIYSWYWINTSTLQNQNCCSLSKNLNKAFTINQKKTYHRKFKTTLSSGFNAIPCPLRLPSSFYRFTDTQLSLNNPNSLCLESSIAMTMAVF